MDNNLVTQQLEVLGTPFQWKRQAKEWKNWSNKLINFYMPQRLLAVPTTDGQWEARQTRLMQCTYF